MIIVIFTAIIFMLGIVLSILCPTFYDTLGQLIICVAGIGAAIFIIAILVGAAIGA